MNNFLRTIIAGYGAKKLGGGCLSTIIVFIVIYYALGTCNSHPAQTRQTRPAFIQPPPNKIVKIKEGKTLNLKIALLNNSGSFFSY